MNSPTTWLCLFSLFVPSAIGSALALALHRRMAGWAYLVGYAVPLLGLVALYALYLAIVRAKPCEPAGSLACGEATGYALVIFLVFIAITIIAGAFAQVIVFLVFRVRRRAAITVVPSNQRG